MTRSIIDRLLCVWRELLFASTVVAFVVTPADIVLMIFAIPPILIGMSMTYAYATYRMITGADDQANSNQAVNR